jgi:hypothetical protein
MSSASSWASVFSETLAAGTCDLRLRIYSWPKCFATWRLSEALKLRAVPDQSPVDCFDYRTTQW